MHVLKRGLTGWTVILNICRPRCIKYAYLYYITISRSNKSRYKKKEKTKQKLVILWYSVNVT